MTLESHMVHNIHKISYLLYLLHLIIIDTVFSLCSTGSLIRWVESWISAVVNMWTPDEVFWLILYASSLSIIPVGKLYLNRPLNKWNNHCLKPGPKMVCVPFPQNNDQATWMPWHNSVWILKPLPLSSSMNASTVDWHVETESFFERESPTRIC